MSNPHYYHVRYVDGTFGFVLRDSETGKLIGCYDRVLAPRPNTLVDYTVLQDMGLDDGSEMFLRQLDKRGAIRE